MEEIKQYAPVYIPTLNRFDHFKRCLESLEKCSGADKTDVYVGLDYPPSEKYVEGWKKIDIYLLEKERNNSFKKLVVRRRTQNCGVGNPNSNASLLRKEIEGLYSYYIFSEDDNEFSLNFLEYMNYYLSFYENDDTITSVSGYSFPIDYNADAKASFRTYCSSPWGSGRWTRKNKDRAWGVIMDKYLLSCKMSWKLFKKARWLFDIVVTMRYRNRCYTDEAIRTNNLLEGDYSIAPIISKVRNIGYDSTGINCVDDNGTHATQMIDDSAYFENGGVIEIKDLNKKYQKYFDKGIISDIKAIIKYFIIIIRYSK